MSQKLSNNTVRIDLCISREQKEEIKKRAQEMDLSMSDYLRLLADEDIKGGDDDE